MRLVRALVPVSLFAISSSLPTRPHAVIAPVAFAHLTGKVTDASTSQPLQAAQLTVRETSLATQTNEQGNYVLAIPVDSARGRDVVMLVRRVGYAPLTRSIHLAAGERTENLALQPAMLQLAEVVVTGTAVSTQRTSVGSSVATVSAAPAAPPPSTVTVMRGRTAGLTINGAARTTSARAKRDSRATPNDSASVDPEPNTEVYDAIAENPFLRTASAPRSTFSIDVDHASYSNVRRFLQAGQRPPADAVRLEELINYFPYDLPAPTGDDPVSITTEVGVAPWNSSHRLLRVGLRGRPIAADRLPPNNLVFLIDVSGSMESPDKLPLLKSAFRLLVNELRPQDRVALVVYAGNAGIVLPSTAGDRKELILEAIDRLEAGGSTAGGAGLRLAYDVAKASFMRTGNNRVILATDGDFNVGVSSDAELVKLIEERREQGTFLTVLGFGTGNIKDSKMEKLADKGNGNYAYVDNLMEARKVLVTEMGATLLTIAKDVKLQLEFNPTRVAAYRLLGYENRMLRDEDFTDDRKDAGELGAGHSVTALYELIPPGAADLGQVRKPNELRYSAPPARTSAADRDELLYVRLRYKPPTERESRELTHLVRDETARTPSLDFAFASAVAEFGMVLRDSPNKGKGSIDHAIRMAESARGEDPFGYRAEFVSLARMARDVLHAAER